MLKSISLNSYWNIRFDEEDRGIEDNWHINQPDSLESIWVPSCWNELREEYLHYVGVAWYYKKFLYRESPEAKRQVLFFNGINYKCRIWLNGKQVGRHTGGFTPFEVDITNAVVKNGENFLVIRVDSTITNMTSPPYGVDWFNYGGIYRDVQLLETGEAWIDDVTVRTKMSGDVGIKVDIGSFTPGPHYALELCVNEKEKAASVYSLSYTAASSCSCIDLKLEQPKLWSPDTPYLYEFMIVLKRDNEIQDIWEHKIGVREFSIKNRQVYINEKRVNLRGYAKHEEYPMLGRTFSYDIVRKDYEICKQGNANLVRLVHYPHHLQEYEIASETGMVAIAEVPNVNFKKEQFMNPELLELAVNQMKETIKYCKNEACIMFWSLFIECKTYEDAAVEFVRKYIQLARESDPTRFTVHASDIPLEDRTYEYFDVVGINYWRGWYGGHTIEEGSSLLDKIAARYPDKPVLMTSGGWEGLYGSHSYRGNVKWSEESQADYLEKLTEMYIAKPYIIGQVVWTFNDFRVWPWVTDGNAYWPNRPMEMNYKGAVDCFRRPKLAYYRLQETFKKWDGRGNCDL